MPARLTVTLLIFVAAGIALALSVSAWLGRAQPRQAPSRPHAQAWPSSPNGPTEIRVAPPRLSAVKDPAARWRDG
jgi:hypothetical protein